MAFKNGLSIIFRGFPPTATDRSPLCGLSVGYNVLLTIAGYELLLS